VEIEKLLADVRSGAVSVEAARDILARAPYEELGYAKLDFHRKLRRGEGETVFCSGKLPEHLTGIFAAFAKAGERVLGTRATAEQFAAVKKVVPNAAYDPVSRLITLGEKLPGTGTVAVCTGGTSDIPVAEEAAQTAEFFGSKVVRCFDVGVAGIHRLFAQLETIRSANVVIAVAGMEGALGSVISGLVASPVIAVPTSVGYGASFQGIAPLLSMLNSCAEGMSVVNIDNGFGAGYLANRINRMVVKGSQK